MGAPVLCFPTLGAPSYLQRFISAALALCFSIVRGRPWPFVASLEVLFSRFGTPVLYFPIRGRFGQAHLGHHAGPRNVQKVFPCSVALVPFRAGAFPCSVALVFRFGVFLWKVTSSKNHPPKIHRNSPQKSKQLQNPKIWSNIPYLFSIRYCM